VSTRSRYISPEEIIETPYPYRRVWASLIREGAVLFATCIATFVLWRLVAPENSRSISVVLEIGLLILPVGLWSVFSLWRERSAEQPRMRLFAVFIITLLAANAVSLLIVEIVFQPSRWLPHESAITRIVGYSFTVGVVQAVTQYLVVYYVTYPQYFRVRTDAIAYFSASAIGYATALNLRFLLDTETTPDIFAFIVFNNVAISLAMGFVTGFGLAETRFGNRTSPFLLTLTIISSALIYGASVAFRAGLVNAGFSLQGGNANPVLGLALSVGVVIGTGVIISFLFRVAERREAESALERN
jgi:RsiW-degrading membrane proteinase PrsW (M82 family)